jgi:serine/threonine-protein kinase
MSEQAERLYERARELSPEARAALVEEACRDDPRLRDELLSLLREADAAETFFRLFGDALLSGRFPIHQAEDGGDDEASGRTPSFPRAEPRPGTLVGHYRVLSFIGRGGMGSVYRAHDTVLERPVALKFLPPLSTRLDEEERLLREARSAAALEHPNICTIHEIGRTDDGRPFIAMAFHEGQTLKEKLEQGPLSNAEAVATGIQIARGLKAAHARGILHRDVKPANVVLGSDGTARLLDFGLATVADATLGDSEATPGTLAYMSPEQVRGEPLDAKSDLWSLGVVLYEMITGRRPFRGEGDRTLLQSILGEDPEPVSKRTSVPASLASVVERLLSKDASKRYGSAAEVVADLTQALPPGSAPRAHSRPRRRAAWLVGSAASLVALVGLAIWFPERVQGPVPAVMDASAEPSIAVLPLANLSGDPGGEALADGVTEELISILARTGDLRVIATTSVFAFKGHRGDVRAIADSLGVSYILEGGLQKSDSRLHVQIRLVDSRDGSTRWSQTYDREFTDVFAVQDDIARAVVGELGPRLDGGAVQPRDHLTGNVAAYELYLRGNSPDLSRSDDGVRQQVKFFEQAIAVDSTYAAAYAGLATARSRLGSAADPGMPLSELYALAEDAARTAVALDDSLAEAHRALGRIRMGMFDFVSAKREIERAIALDPTNPLNRIVMSGLHRWAEEPGAALAETRQALEADPLSPVAHAAVAEALFANRRYDEALAQLDRIRGVRPPLRRAVFVAGRSYAEKGMFSEAIAVLRPQAEAGDPMTMAFLGHTLARAGQREEAQRILADLLARQRRIGAGAFEVAIVYAGLEEFDQAFAWLDRSVDDLSLGVPIMDPTFEDLRRDPRFERLSHRLGLQKL